MLEEQNYKDCLILAERKFKRERRRRGDRRRRKAGVGGKEHFIFKGISKCKRSIPMMYKKPWEKEE